MTDQLPLRQQQRTVLVGQKWADGAVVILRGVAERGEGKHEVELRREPRNPKDSRAVAVYIGAHKLGYIPAKQNATISAALDGGVAVKAVLSVPSERLDVQWETPSDDPAPAG